MRYFFTCILLLFTLTFSSCKQRTANKEPLEKPENILNNPTSFSNYWYKDLKLSDDFIALSPSDSVIPKGEFLKQVATGEYLPLRLISGNPVYYELYKITTPIDPLITTWLKDLGTGAYNNYQWEGKALPAINYKDIDGNIYTQQTIKGKILVLNFWFIGCTACVAEMPDLNKLVNQYKNRKDILFVDIAINKEDSLKKFLSKRSFDYKTVSDPSGYLLKIFKIRAWPTQVVIDKNGNIVKILNGYNDDYKTLAALVQKVASS
ncbi:MAG TPA: TlpA disulfide reductase family protein [Hanamia sp.]|nr:TlpA disulfide reductase family protein [Hanamia sp.]